jgi:hypothetical protein
MIISLAQIPTPPTPSIDRFFPAILGVLVAVFASFFFFLKEGNQKISVKFFILYTLGAILVFAISLFEPWLAFDEPMSIYVYNQVAFIIIGIIHTVLLRRLMGIDETESFVAELGAAIVTAGLVYLSHGVNARYALVFASVLLAMLVPFLFYRSFIYLVWIPAPVYKKWYYNVDDEVEINEEMFADKNITVLKYSIQRTVANPKDILDLRLKSSLRIELGKMIKLGIDENNDKNVGKEIEYSDEFSQPYGWNFYIQPKWYQGARYLDPDLTIAENGLKEGEVIVIERILD